MEASTGKRITDQREPASGIIILALIVAVSSGILIHSTTLQLEWDKLPRFISIIVGASATGIAAGIFHRYVKILLMFYAVAALAFVVGLLIWINI